MYCRKCGKQLSANDRVCPGCGANQTDNNQQNTATVVAGVTAEKPKKKGKGLVILAIILASVIVLAGVVFGVYIYIDSNTGNYGGQVQITSEEPVEDEEQTEQEEFEETSNDKTNNPVKGAKEDFLIRTEKIEEETDKLYTESMDQMTINQESYAVYVEWDTLLNDVYQYLKETMPEDEFEKLRKEEIQWIKEKEAAMEASAKEWEGGSGESMARNLAAIDYTRERCYELIDMID